MQPSSKGRPASQRIPAAEVCKGSKPLHSPSAIAAALRAAPKAGASDRETRIDVFIKLLAATDAARTELRRQLAAQGLTELGFEVLTAMQSQSSPEVPPSVISDATGILRGTLTDVLVRLEICGLITRRRNSTDRRQFFAELTPLGRKRCGAASEHYCGAIVDLMAKLDHASLLKLDHLLGQIAQSLAEVQQRTLLPVHEI